MTTDTQVEQDTEWKQKYFDKLEEFDRNQVAWSNAEDLLRRTIVRLALAAQGLDAELDVELDRIRAAIRDHVDHRVLSDNIDTLSKALVRLDQQRESRLAESAAKKATSQGGIFRRLFKSEGGDRHEVAQAPMVSADHLLLDLLDRLEFPDLLKDQAGLIRQQIATGYLNRDWTTVVEEVAELIESMRCLAKQEQAGIEEFLSQVSERLREMDRHLRGSAELQQLGVHNRDDLDDVVRREVQGIETSVRDAIDIGQLKSAVRGHLESVTEQMSRFRASEDIREQETRKHLDRMRERIETLETETGALREQVNIERLQATTDALTGIPNRLAYEQRLKEDMARWKRFGTPLVLLVWDVDRFKSVNDNYGHKAGDKVLKKIAQILHGRLRETDFVARYGGEEFVMLMAGTTLRNGLIVANELRVAVEQTGFHFRDQLVNITVSCGIAESRDGDSANQLFERADKALYSAKEQGRNRCVAG